MGDTVKKESMSINDKELEELYEIYLRVQSGDKTALNNLFQERNTDNRRICRADLQYKKQRLSNMDNVLDSELVLANEQEMEKEYQEREWITSSYSKVTFRFTCLNNLLYKKKKKFLSKEKNTGYENGKKKKNSGHRKFYEGAYDISDFNELMYETIIEIFHEKTDENNYLTLDGKKNEEYPICDGVSLLQNISYFTSRKINKRAETSYLDIPDMEYSGEEAAESVSYFEKKALKDYLESTGGTSRLRMYAEFLDWLKRNDVHKLFKANACGIRAIIETIMNCEETFIPNMEDNIEGFGLRFVKQETLQEIIQSRHHINIEQGNISKDLEIIEQRLLDHLLYSLNYRIDKAEERKGSCEKESERFLRKLDNEAYVKIFSRTSCTVYEESAAFVNRGITCNDSDDYLRRIRKYEDMIMGIVSKENGKKKYEMENLILDKVCLVKDKNRTSIDIANTLISYCQKKEEEYRKDKFTDYRIKDSIDWKNGYWEAELGNELLDIRLWSGKGVKRPVRSNIRKENLMVYCGYANYYLCDTANKIYYRFPKDRRIISKSNRNHEISMYSVG